jgi:hypothetical protein
VNYFVIASAKVAPFSAFANFIQPFFDVFLTFNPNSLIYVVLRVKVFSSFFGTPVANPEKSAKSPPCLHRSLKNKQQKSVFTLQTSP